MDQSKQGLVEHSATLHKIPTDIDSVRRKDNSWKKFDVIKVNLVETHFFTGTVSCTVLVTLTDAKQHLQVMRTRVENRKKYYFLYASNWK